MKLITEQVTIIQQEIQKLAAEIKVLNETKEREKATYYTRAGDSDYDSISKIQENANKIQKLSKILEDSTIIPNPNSERVELGSHFRVFLKWNKNDMDFFDVTLIEAKVSKEPSPDYLTQDSDFGKAVYHKKLGSRFRYYDKNGNRVEGLITSMEYDRPGIGKTHLKIRNTK